MENDTLQKPMSLAKKSLLSAGGLAILSGFLKPGTLAKNMMVNRKAMSELAKAKDQISSHYDKLISSVRKSHATKAEALNKAFFFKDKRKFVNDFTSGTMEAKHQINKITDILKAEQDIAKNRAKITNSLPWVTKNLDKLDTLLPIAGAMSVSGTLLSEKKAEKQLPINATKESQELKKVLVKPNLVGEPVNYTKGFQCGPIIENADKMDKIAAAINELFPNKAKDDVIQQQTREIDVRDEALAQHELAHQKKDEQLKKLQDAVKAVNAKAEHYRGKAIEHFSNHLDAEAESATAVPPEQKPTK